jgi:hypothetical protein
MSNNGRATLPTVISRARAQLQELTGRPAEAVTSVERSDDGWVLSIEVLELARIPDSTSVLGSYQVRVDPEGDLIEYGRTARFYRNRAGEDDS